MYINKRVLIYCMAEIDYDMIKFNDVCLFKQLIYELFAKKKNRLRGVITPFNIIFRKT